MTFQSNQNFAVMPPEYLKKLYHRHWQGALVRSGASLMQWVTREGESVGLILDGDNQLLRRGGLIDISVQHTGIGIKREDLQRIFDPFEQGDNSASRRYQGTGLGLSLTKKLVELHGGKIWAESAGEGKGSKFNFVMPV